MTKNAIVSILTLLITGQLSAGDCLSHPLIIYEMIVQSCEPLTSKNAAKISTVASPKTIAAKYSGLILTGNLKRKRRVDLDEPLRGVHFKVNKWEKTNRPMTFLFSENGFNDCKAFQVAKVENFAYFTDCGCDTGARADGYCALTVLQVSRVPQKYSTYAK